MLMDWTTIAVNSFQGFFLIFVRIISMLASVPFFGFHQIPNTAKIGFAYFLALLLLPLIKIPVMPEEILSYGFLVAQQVLIGILFGFVSFVFFSAIQLASQFMDLQMGFGLANVIDPVSNIQQALIGQIQFLMTILFFITMNGHHLLLVALQKSFQIIPLDGMAFSVNKLMPFIITLFSSLFETALKLCLPVLSAIFLADVALGFLARMMPQMNILVMGFPVKIFVGLVGVSLSFTIYFHMFPVMFQKSYEDIMKLLYLLKP